MRTLLNLLWVMLFIALAALIVLLAVKVLQSRDVVISSGTSCEFQKWRDDLDVWKWRNVIYADYSCGGRVVLMSNTSVLSDQLHGRGSRVECAMTNGTWISDLKLVCKLTPRTASDDLG